MRKAERREDDGFTLVELLIAISILGLVMTAVVAAMAVALRSNKETGTRLTESRDMQFASTWWGDDVQGANRIAVGGAPNCGTDAAAVVRFANTDYLTPPATFPSPAPDSLRVSYVLRNSADGTVKELHRLACTTGGPVDNIVARSLSPLAADAPSVSCAPSCTAPRTVTLTLKQLRESSSATPLTYTLQGTRRSS